MFLFLLALEQGGMTTGDLDHLTGTCYTRHLLKDEPRMGTVKPFLTYPVIFAVERFNRFVNQQLET